MKRHWQIASLLLIFALALQLSASAVSAAPDRALKTGWSSITVWAFVDNDRDGFITPGDGYLHEIGACLINKKTNKISCGATDYGDVWWEPLEGGIFLTRIDVHDSDLPPGHRLNSITCRNTGAQSSGKTCTTRLNKGEAQFNQVPDALMNVYYGFVPEE